MATWADTRIIYSRRAILFLSVDNQNGTGDGIDPDLHQPGIDNNRS
jgi:hypothetical protein